MVIRIPESLRDALRDAEINISVELPNPKIETKADKDGSLSLSASYDIGEIYKTASNVANAIYEAVDNAVIEELLVLNGYVKGCSADRTCKAELDYDAMEDGVPDCRIWRCSCGEAFPYWRGCNPIFCPNCGAKVVEE